MTEKRVLSPKDRRMFKRMADSFFVTYQVRYPFKVRIRLGAEECVAVAQDIGEGGIGVLTSHNVPSNVLLTTHFTIRNDRESQDKSRVFELPGDVRYKIYAKKDKAYRIGICFFNVSKADRNFIANYITTQDLKPVGD